jgi:hypothetical protein
VVNAKRHRRSVSATFRPLAGARRYRLVVRHGKARRSVRCRLHGRGKRRRVLCATRLRAKGRWSATAIAYSGKGRTVGVARRRFCVRR